MSNEKPKPFAEVVVGTPGFIGRAEWIEFGPGEPDARAAIVLEEQRSTSAVAAQLNAAVEQREAKLRGALATLAKAAEDTEPAFSLHQEVAEEEIEAARAYLLDHVRRAREVLAGDGPAYVPAAELAAEQAKVKQLQAALDVLNDASRYRDGEEVRGYLEASGLKKPTKPDGLIVEGGDMFLIAGGQRLRVEVESIEQTEGENRDLSVTLRGTVYANERRAAPMLLTGVRPEPPPIGTSPALEEARRNAAARPTVHLVTFNGDNAAACGGAVEPFVTVAREGWARLTCPACLARVAEAWGFTWRALPSGARRYEFALAGEGVLAFDALTEERARQMLQEHLDRRGPPSAPAP